MANLPYLYAVPTGNTLALQRSIFRENLLRKIFNLHHSSSATKKVSINRLWHK